MERQSKFSVWAPLAVLVAGSLFLAIALATRAPRAPSESVTATDSVADVAPSEGNPNPAVELAPEDDDSAAETETETSEFTPPELVQTADELQAQYEALKSDLPENVSEPLEKDIGVIEGAVAELLAAAAAEPNNDSLKRMLVATYRNEVRLLKKALHLTTDAEDIEVDGQAPE